MTYPTGWYATMQALTPVTSPRQVLAVASYPLPSDSSGADGCQPKEALNRLPPTGAFIFGWEYGGLALPGIRARDYPHARSASRSPASPTTSVRGRAT